MKLTRWIRAVLIGVLFISHYALADSPITSTEFCHQCDEYQSIYLLAEGDNRALTNETATLLTGDLPLGVKLSFVNRLGWSMSGGNNSYRFIAYATTGAVPLERPVFRESGSEENASAIIVYPNAAESFLDKADPDELIIYAYFLALDDYFDVTDALDIAQIAKSRKPNSLAVSMILALIQAQVYLDDSSTWCQVYEVVDAVRNDGSLNQDLSPKAVEEIFEYIGLYEDSCTQ